MVRVACLKLSPIILHQSLFTAMLDIFWTGGSDAGHSESWTWENSQTALTFTDWALGQPMRNTGHCLKMAGFWNYSWQVGDCSKKEFFICER